MRKIIQATKDNLLQIYALTEINIKLAKRFKFNLIMSYINPIIYIIMPMIIMNQFFTIRESFGPWNDSNIQIFIFIAYIISLLQQIISRFISGIMREKYWQTIQGILIAPFNRINLLLGIFLAHIILILIPFVCFFIICFVIYPISFIVIIFEIFFFFLVAMIFGGIGLIIGIFALSHENFYYFLNFVMLYVIMFSCLSYPFQIFPTFIQNIIELNPLYYIFDFLRLAWIEGDIIFTIVSHPFNFLTLIASAITFPAVGVIIFNKVFKRYGIVGY